MGAGFGALVVPLIVVIVVIVALVLGMRSWSSRHLRAADELAGPDAPTLDYVVPPGQDPVVVLSALSAEGFDASSDPGDPMLVHISCPAGPDRARPRARATIRTASTSAIDAGVPIESGPVRFVDER